MKNTRREFIRNTVVMGTVAAGGGVSAQTTGAASSKPVDDVYDVVVVGAGTAGTIAAIQAGRLGMRTLLVEKNGMPGGTTTVAAVNFPGLFHAWGRQIIAGIGWEMVTRTVELCGGTLPDFTVIPERHWHHQVRVNRAIYASLACEEFQKAGVQPLFHAMPAQVIEVGDGYEITLCTKSGLETVSARALIDATGDANVVALAGYPLVVHDERQPGTLILMLTGYDFATLDTVRMEREFQTALREKELTSVDAVFVRNNIAGFLRSYGDNCTHITDIEGRTSKGRSLAEISARISLLRVFRFLRRQPGLEALEITFMASECGIRESATIKGEATVTCGDYVNGRLWEDAICYSFYPIDLHSSVGGTIDTRPLQPGTLPTVPRGALVPVGSKRLLVGGRSLSSDREANSALRVQATCMACGQAAAVLAVNAIRGNVPVMHTDMNAVHADLRRYNAIVPEAVL